jgi:type I restriction enzyme, S subunit
MTVATLDRPRACVIWWHEMDRWVLPSAVILRRRLPPGWIRARVGDLVQRVSNGVNVEAGAEYKMAGVKWYGEGVFHRETVRGDEISARYLSRVVPGALIYNRLFAWKASFAVVPRDLSESYVSNEFPQFIPDESKLLPEFLYLWCISEQTIKAVNAASTGSAAVSRNRFREEFFLDFEMMVPPLAVQHKIVALWEESRKFTAASAAKIVGIEREIEASFLADLGMRTPKTASPPKVFTRRWSDMERWGVMPNQLAMAGLDLSRGKFPVVEGRHGLAEVKHGCAASPSPMPTSLAVLKLSAVTQGYFRPEERKYAFDVPRYRSEFDLRAGDVLMCRTNGTLGLVGMSALVERDMPDLIFPDKLIRVRCGADILPAYFWKVAQMPFVRSQIESAARTAVGNYAIGSDDIWSLRFPLPPMAIQKTMVKRAETRRSQIAELKADAEARMEAARADVEAMILGTKPAE